eukprot:16367724-Heterocapsa_arctica.AAC.1
MDSYWKVGHVVKNSAKEKGSFGHWNEHMTKRTKENEYGGQQRRVGLHTQSEQREKQYYHDNKWTYKKSKKRNQSDMEKVHRGMTAEDIDLQLRNLKKDSNTLV